MLTRLQENKIFLEKRFFKRLIIQASNNEVFFITDKCSGRIVKFSSSDDEFIINQTLIAVGSEKLWSKLYRIHYSYK